MTPWGLKSTWHTVGALVVASFSATTHWIGIAIFSAAEVSAARFGNPRFATPTVRFRTHAGGH
jgi:hypothetical protein